MTTKQSVRKLYEAVFRIDKEMSKPKEGVAKNVFKEMTEGGIHPHSLERENKQTKRDGAHSHLFIFPDGTVYETEFDGWHNHELVEEDSNETKPQTSIHNHRIIINGEEFFTEDTDDHDHQALVRNTAFDGLHDHELEINGQKVRSMSPGEFWVHIGRPSQATNAFNELSDSLVAMAKEDKKSDVSDDKIIALKALGFDVNKKWDTHDEESKTVSISKIDHPRQIVYGAVLEADTKDTQGDKISEKEIEETAHNFIQKSRVIGFRHFKQAKAKLIESVIVHKGDVFYGVKFKKTTWVIGVHIDGPALWDAIDSGKINAFSVGGFAKRTK